MLFWRIHRCARIIFSLSDHLRTMTPQQAVDFLVTPVGHEAGNTAGDVPLHRRAGSERDRAVVGDPRLRQLGGRPRWNPRMVYVNDNVLNQFHDDVASFVRGTETGK
jgi:hypothetical protein